MTSTYGERLLRALTHAHKSRAELAAALVNPEGGMGVSVSSVGQVINGNGAQSAENCARAARFLGVSHYWLATGVGPMLERAANPLVVEEPHAAYGITDANALLHLRNMLQRLDPAMRSAAADVLAGWAREGGAEDRSAAVLGLLAASRNHAS